MSLLDHLRRRAALEGPLSLQEVMADAAMHPDYGYYARREPFGAAGDFTTAPEISQMFGELIGLWAAIVWRQIGCPDPVLLVELGPGRGTLMADALRAARGVPGFASAIRVHLVEASPVLRTRQAETLADHTPAWHRDMTTLPDGPTILLANEFFDALPIVQLVRARAGWRERRLAFDARTGRPVWTLAAGLAPQSALLDRHVTACARAGDVAELCPAGLAVAQAVGERLAAAGGAALIVDYGYAPRAVGDTLQAVRDHRPADILDSLGEADLSAHVDFAALERAAGQGGARTHAPISQSDFLRALGIDARADRLMEEAAPSVRAKIAQARARLIGADEMGTLFKVVAWTGPGAPVPPGFEDSPLPPAM